MQLAVFVSFVTFTWSVFLGMITTAKTLDRETTSSYGLKVQGRDNGSPSRSSIADLSITISDVNDNIPMFSKNPFKFQVSEDVAVQTSIGRIIASDKDTGSNAQLQYRLVGSGGPVSVDANGDVKIMPSIDYEAIKSYAYDIEVSDNGVPKLSSRSKLIIEVKSYSFVQ